MFFQGYIKEEKNPQVRSRRRQPFNAFFSPKPNQQEHWKVDFSMEVLDRMLHEEKACHRLNMMLRVQYNPYLP